MDFAALATDLTTELGTVLTAAAGVITLIIGARAGVRFFKSMVK